MNTMLNRKTVRFLEEVEHMANGLGNEMFAEMYTTAVKRFVNGDATLFQFMKQLERPPVSIVEFMDSPEFLGATDLNIWPEVRKALIDINSNWWKGIEGGAIQEGLMMGACVDADTEYLSPYGWKKISEYRDGDLVGQYNADGTVTFTCPERYVRFEADEFLRVKPKGGVDMALTPGHRVIYRHHQTGELKEISAEDLAAQHNALAKGFKGKFISTFTVPERRGIPLTDEQIRVMVMVHADGSFYEDTEWCNLILKKPRKIARAEELLNAAGISYEKVDRPDGYSRIRFYAPERNKDFSGWWHCTEAQLRVVVDEVLRWDGCEAQRQFYTAKKKEADFIQYALSATGIRATMQSRSRGGNRATEYRVRACRSVSPSLASSDPTRITTEKMGDGYCYCFTLASGMWVARRGGCVFVTGNTGTAKSTISMVSMMYHCYLLGCCTSPQALYGLPKQISIVFPIMGAKPHVVNKVVYAPMRKFIEAMPYFQKYMPPSKLIDSEIYFEDKNIRIVKAGGDEDQILGEAVIGGMIDEINFMAVVQRSKKAEVTSGRAGLYDQASQVHHRMVTRKKGRFQKPDNFPMLGIVFPSSSTRYKGDFTDKRKAFVERTKMKGVYIYNKRQFDVVPQDRFSGEKFRLLIGNDVQHDTRPLEPGESVPPGALVEEVPIEYLDDFRNKPYDTLRDVLGISHNALSPFIKSRHKVYECAEAGREEGLESFLVKDHVILGVDGMLQVRQGTYCTNPSRPRYVHIDLSINGDHCGVAMVCFTGMIEVERQGMRELMPTARLEMAASIEPDVNNEIDIAEVRAFVQQLRSRYGYPIRGVSYDGFNSRESIQAWRKAGMKATLLSVDRTDVPYKQFRDAMYDGRILLLDDPILLDEIINLEYDSKKQKVDHPVTGSKDVADAVCGAYTNMLERRSTWTSSVMSDVDDDGRYVGGERYDEERRF